MNKTGSIEVAIIKGLILALIIIVGYLCYDFYSENCNKECGFDDESYFLGLVRGCDNGCLHDAMINYNLSENTMFEDFANTSYPACAAWCEEFYGVFI